MNKEISIIQKQNLIANLIRKNISVVLYSVAIQPFVVDTDTDPAKTR
jgi:hypothetical protein